MKRLLQTLALMLAALIVPATASAAYVQLADGVYQDGTTLYIGSDVTSLGNLLVNPSVIYCYAQTPPACVSGTFTGYDATLHVPTSAMVSYFSAQYWYNFSNVSADAVEPVSVTLNEASVEVEIGNQFSLNAVVTPSYATPSTVSWSSSNTAVATVSGGTVTTVAPGECDIIAQCAVQQAICHVTVTPELVTITLDQHAARILPNHLLTLTATCTPTATDLAVWSNDNTVAMPRIVNGTIQVLGVKEGTATITVGSVDGTAYTDACEVTVYTEVGDLNSDGYVNMDDLTTMINYLLTDDATGINLTNADTNLSGGVDMDDLTTLINYLLTDKWPWEEPVTYTVNGVSFRMIPVEGGTFMMGSTEEQGWDADDDEYPVHKVTLSSYSIGETEVTQTLWQAVMGSNPGYFILDMNRPIEQVSWDSCQEFIAKLNQMTGKNFRLPTEAEWEYAARGGKKSHGYKYSGSDIIDDVAWYLSNSSSTTHAVASKAPNELGLFDMSGNVLEWCLDWYGNYSNSVQINPTGPSTGYCRVLRGGSWYPAAKLCRVSCRSNNMPGGYFNDRGLRLALDEDNSPKFRLSETVVEIEEGETATVDILNGSGSYSVAGGMDNINSTVDGEALTVTGAAAGTTTVHVTDNTTGAITVLTVVVAATKTFTVNGVTFKMIAVDGGTFMMGATAEQGNDAYDSEYPVHQVTLSGYFIGETEVTQGLWQAVMGSNPSYFSIANGYEENLQRPVETVSWDDCQQFIAKLNQMTGKNFRLPTEAEWEYAARGGNKSRRYKYAGSNTIGEIAWYRGNSYALGSSSQDYGTHGVGTKIYNELGLCDLSGNVNEWCQDWYGDYVYGDQADPTGPDSGMYRVFRGGCWVTDAIGCRVSYRNSVTASTHRSYILGLRLAL